MEVLAVLIFVLIVILTPFLFVGWVIFTVVRSVAGGVTHSARAVTNQAHGAALPGHTVRCPTNGCLAVNPADARFCRRCGHGLPAAHRVQVRRAAVW
jgi:hypothetical protein